MTAPTKQAAAHKPTTAAAKPDAITRPLEVELVAAEEEVLTVVFVFA
jgi:hypothetical protein